MSASSCPTVGVNLSQPHAMRAGLYSLSQLPTAGIAASGAHDGEATVHMYNCSPRAHVCFKLSDGRSKFVSAPCHEGRPLFTEPAADGWYCSERRSRRRGYRTHVQLQPSSSCLLQVVRRSE